MLGALKNQLRMMAVDSKDSFTSVIRGLVGPREAMHYERPVRQMILAMPEMIAQISTWSHDPRHFHSMKRLHGFVLITLYNFKPDHKKGLVGYVEDAYLVASAYHRTLNERDRPRLRLRVDNAVPSKSVAEWIETTKQLFPDETRKLDQILDELGQKRGRRKEAKMESE